MSEDAIQPSTAEAVQEAILAALESGEALEVVGGGSKRFYGRPVRAARVLDVSGLTGIVDYQPHELILVARPATPLAELERTLAAQGQQFAFEPPHWGDGATLGGTLACNLSGPRRFKAGAARDHLLGFQAVTGRGEMVRGGGKVVKNVTGYDLSKLMCGSFGTLGVLTEVVVKVLPRAETERTVLLPGLSDGEGLEQLIAASRSSHEPGALAHLPPGTALPADAGAAAAIADGGALTAVRLEGPAPSVRTRSEGLVSELASNLKSARISAPGRAGAVAGGAAEVLGEDDSRAFWEAIRELAVLPLEDDGVLWRLSAAPTAGAGLGEALKRIGARRLAYDWGGALVWAVLPADADGSAIHRLAGQAGGHATRVRAGSGAGPGSGAGSSDAGNSDTGNPDTAAPEAGFMDGAVFSELSAGQHRLNLNLKLAFDPARILNPGRMYPDI